ncbi:MAG: dihydrolipoyllysine-residue succinyltransferase [Betaproteobacteria bacterium]|nr:MAG: dihydrolipoyllysine-residue succinyltransferase [Betaproteobacteria bacterium]
MIEIKVPELSESVSGGRLLAWRKAVGETVARDEILVDLETDKVVLEIGAPAAGVLSEIVVPEGGEVVVGQVIARLDGVLQRRTPTVTASAAPAPVLAAPPVATASAHAPAPTAFLPPSQRRHAKDPAPSPVVPAARSAPLDTPRGPRGERRVPMSRLRLRIAERLKEAQNTAAILTTFNEVNMQPVQAIRQKYKDSFQAEHGVKLGMSSFFVKAVCHALKQFPIINARIDGRDIVYQDYCDIGVAVSSERGLVVPILRAAETLSLAEIERRIADFAKRANALQLKIDELEGGTFTVSNGGVFGSLLSTPILNPPQSAVLGLHKIQDRPVAEAGQVVIRPMMYMAVSYDHRSIDGRDAVSFLVSVKEALEDPARLLLDV